MSDQSGSRPSTSERQPQTTEARLPYEAPRVLHRFQLEALAVLCTDVNAKNEVALGCNPGALFS